MLPAVDRKCNTSTKEKTFRKIKEKKKNQRKPKSFKKHCAHTSNKYLTQYSDVSSEELSSSEAGEIHSDFDDKHGIFRLNHNKIITNNIRITRVTTPQHLLEDCSPLSTQWDLDSILEDSSMSNNLSLNNCIDMTEVAHLKCKKNKKLNKKPKSPGSKRKKKKKDLKHNSLPNCDNSYNKYSKLPNLELSKRNGDFIEPINKNNPVEEKSHTPPLTKPAQIRISKVEVTHKEEEKHSKHLRKDDKR